MKSRGELLEKSTGCVLCTSWAHPKEKCSLSLNNVNCGEKLQDGQLCTKLHNRFFHGCEVPYCSFAKVSISNVSDETQESNVDVHANTLMLLQDIEVGGYLARAQFDTGSSRILVTNDFARKANLKAIPVEFYMQVVDKGWELKKGNMYVFNLTNRHGKKIEVWGYGIDVITDPIPPTDLSLIKNSFPQVPSEAFENLDEKPLDILIGLNFFGLHPKGGEGKNAIGNLVALRSQFGCGWVIGGSDPKLKPAKVTMTAQAVAMATVSKVEVKLFEQKDLWEMDNLGVLPAKRCNNCKNCKFCTDENLMLSFKEEEEFRLIDESITVENGKTLCKFPFIKDPNVLSNNRLPMLKRSERLEQSLKRSNLLDSYNEEFQKFLDRGVISEVNEEDLKSYEGPQNYISHHGVLQPWKVTTPLRIVSNSSQDNRGHSVNSCLPKGPNCLSNLYEMLLKFRAYEVSLVFDILKAYHTLNTGLVEKFL